MEGRRKRTNAVALRVTKRYVDERPKTHQDIDDQADHATHGARRCPLTPPYNS